MEKLLIGTRGSKLSIAQTMIVARKIEQAYPEFKCELVTIKTLNEKIDRSTENTTDKDIYTKEIDIALAEGSIDLAVHSLKDLKNELDEEIMLASVPERASPLDCIVKGKSFGTKLNPIIGTSSIRRRAQIGNIAKKAVVKSIHGNVDTRLRSLESAEIDALVLASSGISRLGYDVHYEELGIDLMVPAIGQGALAVTVRKGNNSIIGMMRNISDKKAESEVMAERAFGRVFEIGCDMPIGALAAEDSTGRLMTITGFLSNMEGTKQIKKSLSGSPEDPEGLGRKLGELMMKEGGDDIIADKANE